MICRYRTNATEDPDLELLRGSFEETELAFYRGFFDAAREALIVLNDELDIVLANGASTELFGGGRLTTPGAYFLDAVTELDRHLVRDRLEQALAGTASENVLAVCRRADGSEFPVELTSSAFELDGENVLSVVVHDRTLADAAMRKLRSEQELYRTLFMTAPVPMREEDFSAVGEWLNELRGAGVTDIATYIDEHQDEFLDAISRIRTIRVNPAFSRLMKSDSEEDLLRKFDPRRFTDETLESFRRQFITIWNGGSGHEAEFIGYNRKGEAFESFITVNIHRIDGKLDLSRVVVAILDLTEIRSNQRSLEQLVADKDRFIASVSHELRTPLAAVMGLSDELFHRWEEFEPTEAQTLLGLIAEQSADLASLVEDLLVAAKMDMGELAVHEQVVELVDQVNATIDEIMHSGNLSARPEIAGAKTWVVADPVRVRQIIRNLLTNAERYGGSSVRVEIKRVGDTSVALQVSDDGDGIPLEDRERIFEAYQRAQGPDGHLGALGLGLTIARQLARLMSGDLTYAYTGGRSIFSLTLPTTETLGSEG